VQFEKATLVGVGLLGGSLGLALRQRRLARQVVGFVRRAETQRECARLGVTDATTRQLAEAVRDADLVVFCTPIGQMEPLVRELARHLRPDALVTDVGSVKVPVVERLEPCVAGAGGQFVGGHPMAGSERAGVGAARADLFVGATCVVTPTPQSAPAAVAAVEGLWRAVGGEPLRLAPALHDELVSRSSHLPHVVAAELANYVLSPAHAPAQARLCAAGFRDTTRIAAGSPEMWRDIALANRGPLARVLGVFIEDLQEFRHALDHGDAARLEEFFRSAKQRRDAWQQAHRPPAGAATGE
jgi:prephenate dehydrogenase